MQADKELKYLITFFKYATVIMAINSFLPVTAEKFMQNGNYIYNQ